MPVFHDVPVKKLHESPENKAIFEDFDPMGRDKWFAEDVAANGVRDPIKVTREGLIIDGHRRFYAARRAKLATIPCIILDNAQEAAAAFKSAQLGRNKSLYSKVMLCRGQIADLSERSKQKQKRNVMTTISADEALENDWVLLEQNLGTSRLMLTRGLRCLNLADSNPDPELGERARQIFRNRGLGPAMRLMGEIAENETSEDLDPANMDSHISDVPPRRSKVKCATKDPEPQPLRVAETKEPAGNVKRVAGWKTPEKAKPKGPFKAIDRPWQDLAHDNLTRAYTLIIDNQAETPATINAVRTLREAIGMQVPEQRKAA